MKKNVSGQKVGAQLVSATDGSPVTTGTTTVYVTGDAGTQAAGSVGSGAATHEGNGYWTYAPAQGETNYDLAAFTFVNSAAVNVTVQVYTSFPQTGDSFARIGAPVGADISADIAALPTAAENADAVWDEARSGHTTAGTFGGDAVDAPANFDALVISAGGTVDSQVKGVDAGAITAAAIATDAIDADAIAADAITEIQSGLSAPTAAEVADAVWDEAQSGHVTAGTFGAFLDSSVSGVSTGGVSAADIADAVLDEALSGHVTAGTLGKAVSDILDDTGTSGVVVAASSKTGYSLSSAGIQAIWDALTSALTTVGSIGKLIVDNINATISSRLASSSYTAPLDAAGVRTAVGLASANLDTQLGALPTAAENASAVLTTQMTESYAADGAAPTLTQAVMLIQQMETEKAVSGDTVTVKKLDGSTTAATLTLNDSSAPTSITRTT